MGIRRLVKHPSNADCRAAVLLAALLAALLFAASGCRMFKDDVGVFVDVRDDYIEATVGQPLEVPEGMESSVGDTWPIPDIVEQPTAKTYVNEVPRPRVLAGANVDAIKIQKLGSKAWVVLADAPEQVWPLVKRLVETSGVGLAREDPPAGIVETAWFAVDADASDILRAAVRTGLSEHESSDQGPWLDRVQVRVERGIRLGSSEVHVVHYRTKSGNEGGAADASAVPEVEGELIARIADYLAQGVAAGSVSMIGREIASETKARIVEDASGIPTLVLNVDFDRAWATVDGALERAGMEVTDTDRDNATFRAVVLAERRSGFFSRILSGGDDGGTAVTLRLHDRTDGVVVEVRDGVGQPVSRELAEKVLLTLRQFAA